MSPDLLLTLVAAVIVVAGLLSIMGALKRTADRPPHSADSRGDGGAFFGSPHDGRHGHHGHDDGSGDGDGSDSGGDGGGD